MAAVKRFCFDGVLTLCSKFGSIPDDGYSWLILLGVALTQMTVPSVLSMYSIVQGYLISNSSSFYFDLWNEVTLVPLLFVAFWSLADPWTKNIMDLASTPRLIGLIGVVLLITGVIVSGYLTTGGVGAYLTGAVMGIGASLVIVESETALRKHFRMKLRLALTLKNIAVSIGFTLVPVLTHFLLAETDLKTGFLLMTIIFVPTVVGTLILSFPILQRPSHYRLLLTDKDNISGIKIFPDRESESDRWNNGADNNDNSGKQKRNVKLFINPVVRLGGKWKQEFRVTRYFRFWVVIVTWTGMKAGSFFFWILVPALFLQRAEPFYCTIDWVMLLVVAGIGSFVPSIASYWSVVTTAQYRRIYFGGACWISSFILLNLTFTYDYYWFLTWSLLGGVSISISSMLTCLDLTLYDVLGNQFAHRSHRLFSTIIGLGVLAFYFVHDENVCLCVVALLQFLGGCYWIVPPIWEIIARRLKEGQQKSYAAVRHRKIYTA